jgi:hypothetical protein
VRPLGVEFFTLNVARHTYAARMLRRGFSSEKSKPGHQPVQTSR